jgi:hypothetical protein
LLYFADMSTNLTPLESDDASVAGFVIAFDSGVAKSVVWRSDRVISPALDAAKTYTAEVIDALMKDNREAELRDTNWVSVCAAAHKLIRDFNGRIHALETVGSGQAH